ncbi:methyltransferase [Streptomyces sp. NPDC018031]|uniref:methyltransferase n=1 Tax=Streptomyces sp. NPDC018031 TaxID=3365033 RepID=UPI00378C804C
MSHTDRTGRAPEGPGEPGELDELDGLDSALDVRRLLYGHLVSRALCSVAELSVPDLLAEGPRTVGDLARETGAHEASLRQLMTALCAFEVFTPQPPDGFGLARLGRALTTDSPGNALSSALLAQAAVGRAWSGLPDVVRTGVPAFEREFGGDFFGFLERNPEVRGVFDRSQSADLDLEISAVLRAGDFSGARTVVDVGGGDGALLARVLRTHPGARGVLVDRPAAVTAARKRMAELGLAERADVREGDFFAALPGGGDVYLLREILHDWDDEQCLAILRTCRRAMSAGTGAAGAGGAAPAGGAEPGPAARLFVIERAAEDGHDTGPDARLTAMMSLYMLSLLPGRERTAAEFGRLLHAAGLRVTARHRLLGHKVLIEAVAAG